MIRLCNLSKMYSTEEVRTTALNSINLEIGAGDYWFEGRNVAGCTEAQLNKLRRGRIGFIFQSFNLIEELNVFENVELALEYVNVPGKERKEKINAMLEKLGISHR